MKRHWTGRCRYCDAEHPARGAAWLSWYLEHLHSCARFLAVEQASRPRTLEVAHGG